VTLVVEAMKTPGPVVTAMFTTAPLTRLLYASSILTVGGPATAEPAIDVPGDVVQMTWLGAAAMTVNELVVAVQAVWALSVAVIV